MTQFKGCYHFYVDFTLYPYLVGYFGNNFLRKKINVHVTWRWVHWHTLSSNYTLFNAKIIHLIRLHHCFIFRLLFHILKKICIIAYFMSFHCLICLHVFKYKSIQFFPVHPSPDLDQIMFRCTWLWSSYTTEKYLHSNKVNFQISTSYLLTINPFLLLQYSYGSLLHHDVPAHWRIQGGAPPKGLHFDIQIFQNIGALGVGTHPPYEVGAPSNGKYWIRHCRLSQPRLLNSKEAISFKIHLWCFWNDAKSLQF